MIALFTDFGAHGPYLGLVRAVLCDAAPGIDVVDLVNDAPRFQPRPAAYLLAALVDHLPASAVVLCVVDPGVGTAHREPLAVRVDDRWLVGPGNGLLSVCAARASRLEALRITWRPPRLSASFHGRDLFAPVAARLARGEAVEAEPIGRDAVLEPGWPEDLAQVIYLDGYGNAMTGLRAARLDPAQKLAVGREALGSARTFGDVPAGAGFWYENSVGLAEIAVNRGSAAERFGLSIGAPVEVGDP